MPSTDPTSKTLTFLFSDIEGSTRLWEVHGSAMEPVLALHDAIARRAVADADGSVFKNTGDGLGASFASAADAVRAAVEMQRAFDGADWHPAAELRARIGIHSGVAQHRDGDYFGRAVNRCARLMSVANGGQIVISGTSQDLLADLDEGDWTLSALGVHQLKDLSRPELVFQVNADGLPSTFPKLRTVDAHPRSLPRSRGPLIGRKDLLDTLLRRLDSDRLTTLVGPGGVGKSRLAAEAAEQLLAAFPDGAWFCSLKDLTTADEMAAAISEVMRIDVADPADVIHALLAALGDRAALVVLDGCEAGPGAACDLIEEILDSCPTVRLVATSRERFRLRVGQVAVDPLDLPDPGDSSLPELAGSPSVRLFVERAVGIAPDFELTVGNCGAVAEICRRLDGLPLALELAAAQVGTFDPAHILTRLDKQIALGPRGEGPTMEAIVAWSYESLSERHRHLFAQLSVFDGGFDLPAAEAVCSDDARSPDEIGALLGDLVDKSLLARRRDAGTVRFSMLGLLRQFARDRLAEFEPDRRTEHSHFAHSLALATEGRLGLRGRDEADWVRRLDTEFANIRAAFRSACASQRFDSAAHLVWAIYPYAFGRTRYEVIEWAETVLDAMDDESNALAPELLAIIGWGAAVRGDVQLSAAHGWRAVEVARQQGRDRYLPHRVLVVAALLSGDIEEASARVVGAHDALAASPDDYAEIELLGFEAFILATAGRREDATAMIDAALTRSRELGNPSLMAWCLYQAGSVDSSHDPDAAATALDHALELAELVQNRYIIGIVLMVRTHVNGEFDDPLGSLAGFSEVLEHWYRLANWTNLGNAIRLFANFLAANGQDASAGVVLGGLAGIAQRAPQSLQTSHYIDALSALEDRLSHRDLESHTTRGAALDMRALVSFCQEEIRRLTEEIERSVIGTISPSVGG